MNVLIIDDHPLFREGLRLLLTGLDDSIQFQDVPGINSVTDTMLQQADLILLDLLIAGSRGIETLQRVRERQPAGVIVIISGIEDPGLIRRCIEGGAAGFIPKSSQSPVLIAALKLVLSGGIYLPPQLADGQLTPQSRQASSSAVNQLTRRQLAALLLAARGMLNKTIADRMGIVEGTVKLHLSSAYKTLGVKNRTEAVYLISELGLNNQLSDDAPGSNGRSSGQSDKDADVA